MTYIAGSESLTLGAAKLGSHPLISLSGAGFSTDRPLASALRRARRSTKAAAALTKPRN